MAWLVACACLGIAPAWAQGAGPVIGEVLVLKGEAWIDGQPLRPGDRLQAGATVRTGQPGRLRLRFEDGSVLVLSDATELRLERWLPSAGGARQASLWLSLGLIGQTVRPQAGGSWQVRTPSAVTAVRGTEFLVEVDAGHKTAVHVQAGAVAVDPAGAAAGPTRLLDQPAHGTDCRVDAGCSEVKIWPQPRVNALRERLEF
ncbi:FecR domain-containing protein [Mitsuaria sp. WAJ17]|uniref:FecR family protein n=1 Tax=Mitsuaria sp. WAJ17 TaxID=2761452 RepID=UPI0015FFCE54|nr:FecR domain-containing protein [Mitsuaria sp. WAJ17]MBB2484481.1 FecR domain-containing protein [Mitsuaria sp. WAJ17]